MTKKCKDCEFCFPHEELGYVCADHNYGEDISKTLDLEKACYSEGLEAFINRIKHNEIPYIATKLAQLKVDGRKNIELKDKTGKIISVKAARAKELFGELVVLKKRLDTEYEVDIVFDSQVFNGAKYLIIK